MEKQPSYSEIIAKIEAKRKLLWIKLDPRNFLPIIREEVRYKNKK